MLSYNTSVQNSIFMKRRNQNQKFSFPFFAGSHRRKRNCKEIFGFGIASGASVRGASIIRQNPADFARNTFELRSIYTAIFRKIAEDKGFEPLRGFLPYPLSKRAHSTTMRILQLCRYTYTITLSWKATFQGYCTKLALDHYANTPYRLC